MVFGVAVTFGAPRQRNNGERTINAASLGLDGNIDAASLGLNGNLDAASLGLNGNLDAAALGLDGDFSAIASALGLNGNTASVPVAAVRAKPYNAAVVYKTPSTPLSASLGLNGNIDAASLGLNGNIDATSLGLNGNLDAASLGLNRNLDAASLGLDGDFDISAIASALGLSGNTAGVPAAAVRADNPYTTAVVYKSASTPLPASSIGLATPLTAANFGLGNGQFSRENLGLAGLSSANLKNLDAKQVAPILRLAAPFLGLNSGVLNAAGLGLNALKLASQA